MPTIPFLLLLLLSLAGCASSPQRHPAPRPEAARLPVAAAVAATARASGAVDRAARNADAAEVTARRIVAEGAPAQSPDSIAVVAALDSVRAELGTAHTDLRTTADELVDADFRIIDLGKETARLTVSLRTAEADISKAREQISAVKADLSHQTRLAWKWRAIALAEVLAVGAFFALRNAFPLLKVII